jgi:hypothetical protein
MPKRAKFSEQGLDYLLALFVHIGTLRPHWHSSVSGNAAVYDGKDDSLSGAADCGFNVLNFRSRSTGNNEISCGNSYSSLWHITAWADS